MRQRFHFTKTKHASTALEGMKMPVDLIQQFSAEIRFNLKEATLHLLEQVVTLLFELLHERFHYCKAFLTTLSNAVGSKGFLINPVMFPSNAVFRFSSRTSVVNRRMGRN